MNKTRRWILRIILLLLALLSVILVFYLFSKNQNDNMTKEIDTIKDYGYSLEDRDSKYIQDNFTKLKNVLKEKEIDYKLYAEYMSNIFLADLFTIDNKNSKYDVGGKQFVLESVLENYELNVSNTIYEFVENKNDRKDEYPVVKSTNIIGIEDDKYTYNNDEYDAYKVQEEIVYEKDLGYPKKCELILIKKDDKLYVVSFKGVE